MISMYDVCKEQYQRKVNKETLITEYVKKQKIYIGIFLQNEMLSSEEYQELFDFLTEHEIKS